MAALILSRGGDVNVACVEIFNITWVCEAVAHCVIISTKLGSGCLIMRAWHFSEFSVGPSQQQNCFWVVSIVLNFSQSSATVICILIANILFSSECQSICFQPKTMGLFEIFSILLDPWVLFIKESRQSCGCRCQGLLIQVNVVTIMS